MRKTLFVFCLFALVGLSASAQTFQFDGYCDAIKVNRYGVPKTIFGGTHLQADCQNNIFGGGFVHGVAPVYQTGTGVVLDFSDPFFGLEEVNSSLQFLINANNDQCSWVAYYGPDGVGNYILNAGTCTKIPPGASLVKRPGLKGSTQR
jgi:hypothetical protein